jgi:hypothetical protein
MSYDLAFQTFGKEYRKRLSKVNTFATNDGKQILYQQIKDALSEPWTDEDEAQLDREEAEQANVLTSPESINLLITSRVNPLVHSHPRVRTRGTSWNKGIACDGATKERISLAMKGRKRSPRSEDTRRKISQALKGRKCPWLIGKPGYWKGKQFSQEHLEKLRIARQGRRPMLGKHHSEEARRKISEGCRKAFQKIPNTTSHSGVVLCG